MPPDATCRPDLSDEQRRLLQAASREGYFEVPREVSLSTLAAQLDLSDAEASAILRRGVDAVLRDALDDDPTGGQREP